MSDIEKHLESLIFTPKKEEETWVIFYKGSRLKMLSGKSRWATEHFAKSALRNEFGYMARHRKDEKEFWDVLFSLVKIRRIA